MAVPKVPADSDGISVTRSVASSSGWEKVERTLGPHSGGKVDLEPSQDEAAGKTGEMPINFNKLPLPAADLHRFHDTAMANVTAALIVAGAIVCAFGALRWNVAWSIGVIGKSLLIQSSI